MRTTYLWHPFSSMADVIGHEIVIERGEGSTVWDEQGNRYLDATAGLWFCNVGYGRRELVDAAAEQMLRMHAYYTFGQFANRPALDLAERVAQLSPTGPGSAAFFTSGGSESIDTAAKLARRYWQVSGEPDRTVIIARENAYHGMNAFGTSLAGIPANHHGWGELVGDIVHVPADDVDAAAAAISRYRGRVAAFIGEPVIAAGGVRPPAADYWPAIAEICRRENALLIIDEVVTGFGRLGHWFGSQRYGIAPDLLVGAKGITSGYMPLGVVVAGERVRSALWGSDAGAVRHGYTYSGHTVACAVAIRNLAIIEMERLVDRVGVLEPIMEREVRRLEDHPLVGEVRSVGLLAAVELDADALATRPGLADKVLAAARQRGVLVRRLLGHSIQISPPFVISGGEITKIVDGLKGALDALADSPVGVA